VPGKGRGSGTNGGICAPKSRYGGKEKDLLVVGDFKGGNVPKKRGCGIRGLTEAASKGGVEKGTTMPEKRNFWGERRRG